MDIDQIRKDTPGCGDKLFLNTAGSSLMPYSVNRKIKDYLDQEEQIGGYKTEELREKEIAGFYSETAKLIGCKPKNIAFAHDATDAYAKALSSINFQKGDTIVTTDDDYASNHIQFLSLKKRHNLKIHRIKNLENGDLDLEDFLKLVKTQTPKLTAVTHVPTNSGLIQDIVAIGEICKEYNILYLVDACQSVGQIEVDVNTIQCGFLTATGRKFLRGPRGTGFLYVSDQLLEKGFEPVFIDGGGAIWTEVDKYKSFNTAQRFQTWESPYALMVGLSEAIRYANVMGIDKISAYNARLMNKLRTNLTEISDVQLFDKGSQRCNLLTFRKLGKSLERITRILDENQVYYSISNKEWGLLDYRKKGVEWTIRLSPHYFNNLDEMDRVAEIIRKI